MRLVLQSIRREEQAKLTMIKVQVPAKQVSAAGNFRCDLSLKCQKCPVFIKERLNRIKWFQENIFILFQEFLQKR